MEHGDKGSNPPLEIMHGYYSTLACCGLLDDRSWLLKNEGKVLLAFHRDFLKIQDEFSLLEKGVTKEIQWTGKQAINAMTRYLQVKETFRKKHI